MAKRKGLAGIILLFVILGSLAAAAYLLFKDMNAPQVTLTPDYELTSPNVEFTAIAEDADSNIKSINVLVRKDTRVTSIAKEVFADKGKRREITFKINVPELLDSSFVLEIQAIDDSWAGFGRGNSNTKTYNMRMDLTPPRVSLKSTPPYVRQGGTGCIIYSANKDLARTGVRVADLFFPAFKQDTGNYICFFAFPYYMTPQDFAPELIAVDRVANSSKTSLTIHKIAQKFKADSIKISDSFLNDKADEFSRMAPGAGTDLEKFLVVNATIRAQNVKRLWEIGQETASTMLWKGAFASLPNGAKRAGFADHRTYSYNGQDIDVQTHMGLDLASLAQSPVPAANSGKVIFADYLGIYGNMIIIDHGMNVQSLYSHLSEIGVNQGQEVTRGEIIGRTGSTGMAGGDHLHFGILLAGLEVSPLEWLDAHWIKDNVTDRIVKAGGTAPSVLDIAAPPSK